MPRACFKGTGVIDGPRCYKPVARHRTPAVISALRMGKSDQINPGSSPAMEPQPTVGAAMPEGGEPLAAARPASPAAAAPTSGAALGAGSNPCGKASRRRSQACCARSRAAWGRFWLRSQWRGAGDHGSGRFWGLTLGSIGVVYGDIGTSPLYAFREALIAASGAHGTGTDHIGAVPREIVLGVLSLIVWALILVVTIKYVLILLRADNNGEGGTLSLMALAQRVLGRGRGPIVMLGVIGASMFYGDSVITPAISVLSAVEGLKLVAPALERYVMPDHGPDPRHSLRRPEPRHRQGRHVLRAGHGGVVLPAGGRRHRPRLRRSGRRVGPESGLRRRLPASSTSSSGS